MKLSASYFRSSTRCVNFLLFIILLGFVSARAYYLAFTHDEGLSYTILQGNEGLKNTANHHLLNTWLMRCCLFFFGDSELSLRFPNVLAFLIYLIVCGRILRFSGTAAALLVGIPVLLLNTYLLDFFSLARGYGLSIGCMMGSLYFFLRTPTANKPPAKFFRNFFWVMSLATLALSANLNMVNYYIAVFGLTLFVYILRGLKNKVNSSQHHWSFFALVLLFCVPLLVAIQRLHFLNQAGQLYHGTDSFDSTLFALTISTFDFTFCAGTCPPIFMHLVKWVFVAGFVYIIYKRRFNTLLFKAWLILFIVILGIFIEHYLFSALFPFNRTSVHLLPLYGLFVYLFYVDLLPVLRPKQSILVCSLTALLFSVPYYIHFLYKIDFTTVTEWRLDAHSKEVIHLIEEKWPAIPNRKDTLKVSANWVFLPSLNYYIHSQQLCVQTFKAEGVPASETNYLYDFIDGSDTTLWRMAKLFEDTGTGLYERKGNAGD